MGHVGEPAPDSTEVTLHSSWRGIFASCFGAGLVFLAGVIGILFGGWSVVPTFVFGLGLFLVLVVLLDYPVSSRFTAEGVQRRMMLRHRWFDWEQVSQLTRVRPGIARGLRGLEHGGLAAVIGKRRYLLVDQPESPEEFDVVYRLVGKERADDLGLHNRIRPSDGTHPTWLYRRAKWAPDEANRR